MLMLLCFTVITCLGNIAVDRTKSKKIFTRITGRNASGLFEDGAVSAFGEVRFDRIRRKMAGIGQATEVRKDRWDFVRLLMLIQLGL